MVGAEQRQRADNEQAGERTSSEVGGGKRQRGNLALVRWNGSHPKG
jgi:hypothetical protein